MELLPHELITVSGCFRFLFPKLPIEVLPKFHQNFWKAFAKVSLFSGIALPVLFNMKRPKKPAK